MGYCIEHEEGYIEIKKENMPKILQTLSDYFKGGGSLRWVDGFDIEDMNSEDEYDEPLTLNDIWDDLRYGIKEEDNFYIINDFVGEKYGDDNILFNMIAPYCEDGYFQFCGEDGDHFRFIIKDGEFKEKSANLDWE